MNKKCVLLVCLSLFCCVSLFAQSRRVTVHLRDVSLKELFQEIENQTTYRFSYRNTVIDDSKDSTVLYDSLSIPERLEFYTYRHPDENIIQKYVQGRRVL